MSGVVSLKNPISCSFWARSSLRRLLPVAIPDWSRLYSRMHGVRKSFLLTTICKQGHDTTMSFFRNSVMPTISYPNPCPWLQSLVLGDYKDMTMTNYCKTPPPSRLASMVLSRALARRIPATFPGEGHACNVVVQTPFGPINSCHDHKWNSIPILDTRFVFFR